MRYSGLFKSIALMAVAWLLTGAVSERKQQALFLSIPRHHLAGYLAYHELFPDTVLGQKALAQALDLLKWREEATPDLIHGIVNAMNTPWNGQRELTSEQMDAVEVLARRLPNRSLPGYRAATEEEVLALPPEHLDVARALLITQGHPEKEAARRTYEARLDLMALQILAQLPPEPSPQQKIQAINDFVFFQQGYRFPPVSHFEKAIDTYTFLGPVLDSKKGVCLGVSTLIFCLAQRLDLPLEIVTPPGHIYLRYAGERGEEINIETTARGIHLPTERYLNLNTRKLKARNAKEMVGLTHFNQASLHLREERYADALASYKKAKNYLPDDPLLKEFTGYALFLCGKEGDCQALLSEIAPLESDETVSCSTLAHDLLDQHFDVNALKTLFLPHEEDRAALTLKRDALRETVARCPRFHAGHFQLAGLSLELGQPGEALSHLLRCHELRQDDVNVEFALSQLYLVRCDYPSAYHHYTLVAKLLKKADHEPKALCQLKQELRRRYPAAPPSQTEVSR